MDINKYLDYARSPEAFAVLFAKKHLKQAGDGVWVDILDYDAPGGYRIERLRFRRVECELFPRRTKPKYPLRRNFDSESEYVMACRAVTWEAACRDIGNQRLAGYHGRRYRIDGVCYPADRHVSRIAVPDPETYFIESAPEEIKALAKDLNNRTDPLWDRAMRYVRPEYLGQPVDSDDDGYVFRIRGIRRL
ncbi:MAG: hypothetical protein K2O18_05005 [Oscillospiraceae bacterium]|nr:hypothetical protein [Oscillospiraceae bacterium]